MDFVLILLLLGMIFVGPLAPKNMCVCVCFSQGNYWKSLGSILRRGVMDSVDLFFQANYEKTHAEMLINIVCFKGIPPISVFRGDL